MTFTIDELYEDGAHQWAIVSCVCNLDDAADPLLSSIVAAVREAYGEQDIITIAQPDPSVAQRFDLSAITKAFRMGLPDPDEEGKKPEHLANYRSEATELLARSALKHVFSVEFPAHPQRGKTNQNQPVLGFDGWGLVGSHSAGYALVLVQVKGTDDVKRPPSEARKLAEECRRVPRQPSALCRALSVLVLTLKNSPYETIVVEMLEVLGRDSLPKIFVAPVVIRGALVAHSDDLSPIRTACQEITPIAGRGVVMSLGVDLGEFGRRVMTQARAV